MTIFWNVCHENCYSWVLQHITSKNVVVHLSVPTTSPSVCLFGCPSHPPVHLSTCLSFPPVDLSACLSVRPFHQSICLPAYLSVPSTSPSVSLPVCLYHPPVHLSAGLSVCHSVCLPINDYQIVSQYWSPKEAPIKIRLKEILLHFYSKLLKSCCNIVSTL